jgi:hypothetical protein
VKKYTDYLFLKLINKTMKTLLLIFLSVSLIISCGPSQQQLEAREKAKMDSVAKATTEQVEAERIRKETEEANLRRQKFRVESLNHELIRLKGQLEAAYSKLEDSKQPKFLRTPDEKLAQIQQAKEEVERLKFEISKIESELRNNNLESPDHISAEEKAATEKAMQDSIAAAEQAAGTMR